MDALPSLAQVDLAIVTGPDGSLAPKLIELQGFPSLSAFEVMQADAWNDALEEIPGLPAGGFSPYFSGLTRSGFVDLFRRTVVGAHDPEHVVLLDLHPETQKTYVDFTATREAPRRRARLRDEGREGGPQALPRRRAAGASRSSGSTTGSSSTS